MTATTVTGWLLDTHTMLWMLHGDYRLSKNAARAINGKLPVYHSSASFWEIAIKPSGKDFEVDDNWKRIYPDELRRVAVPLLAPTIDDCRLLQKLPKYHGNPFGRMLVCQAKRPDLEIIPAEDILDHYGVKRTW